MKSNCCCRGSANVQWDEDGLWINGVEVNEPPRTNGVQNITTVNGTVYINGYEWTGDGWKRTLKALWYKWL